MIYRGSTASVGELRTSNRCFAVALTEEVYRSFRRLNGKKVLVVGVAYSQAHADLVVSYQLKDRWVATGVCEANPVIYVEEIAPLR